MKKILLALALFVCGFHIAYSQYTVQVSSPFHFRLGAYGGYNVAEKNPQAGAFFSGGAYSMMAEIDFGWTNADEFGKNFLYLNPSVGFYFGDSFRFYGLIGITNWGAYDLFRDEFDTNKIYCKIKLGIDIPLGKKVFATVNWNYIFNDNNNRHHHDHPDFLPYKNNALAIGIGYVF